MPEPGKVGQREESSGMKPATESPVMMTIAAKSPMSGYTYLLGIQYSISVIQIVDGLPHAVGVALLRHFGTTAEVRRGAIFDQEQIARAVELGLGVAGPDAIELVTGDADSADYARTIRAVLDGA